MQKKKERKKKIYKTSLQARQKDTNKQTETEKTDLDNSSHITTDHKAVQSA